jgi:GAF domain-containing protein
LTSDSRQTVSKQTTRTHEGAAAWDSLAQFDGPIQAFWERFLKAAGQSLPARRVVLLSASVGTPWTALAQWPGDAQEANGDAQAVLQMTPRLVGDAPVLGVLPDGDQILGLRLPHGKLGPQQVAAVVAFVSPPVDLSRHDLTPWAAQAIAATRRYAQSANEDAVDAHYPAQESPLDSKAQRLFEILQLSVHLSRQTRALRMVYELCNALAARFDADRVSLGWFDEPYARLAAVSHIEKFDRLSATSRALESAMEEAADQAVTVLYPSASEARSVCRAHESYALMQGVSAVLSVPLMDGSRVRGVLCLERRQGSWSDEDIWELELTAQLVARPLADLRERDRWWGARVWSAVKRLPRLAANPKHSAWKLAGGITALTLIALCFIPWTYRVDATITIRSKDVLFIPAPFDGYLGQVQVEVGDLVKAGQVLVRLDTRELALEAAMAEADLVRYRREAEKAQATRQLAEMEVNLARLDQSASRLALVRHQLANAEVIAPHAGIVIEGELKKNLGAPLRKGDLLLKLAQVDQTYLELQVDQVDVHEVNVGTRGEFALVGRPDQRFPIVMSRLDPASVLREGRNVFLARAEIQQESPNWWRPGMGGTARLEVGERPLIWVLTHRTVRTLREWFWI